MKNDPIVQQVRDTKDQLAAAFDYDVARIFADLRSRENLVGDRLKDRRTIPNKPMHPSCGSAASEMDTTSPAAG